MKDLNNIQKKLTDIWSYTELELSDFSTSGLRKHLNAISNIVNDAIDELENLKDCSICQHHICDSCIHDMEQSMKD